MSSKLWDRWESVARISNIHPSMKDEVAEKLEKFLKGIFDKLEINGGSQSYNLSLEVTKGIQRILKPYDRRDNAHR